MLIIPSLSGCQNHSITIDLKPPETAVARSALARSLDRWQEGGRESGVILPGQPQVGVADSTRTERALKSYEIIGPLALSGKARPFAVRLELEGPPESTIVRYYVLGQDPLWIYREDDFERTMHWEHKMSGDETPAPATKTAP